MSVVIARVGGIYGPMYQTLNHPIASMRYAAAHGTTAKYGRGVFFADDGCSYCYVKDCTTGIQLVDVADSLPHKIYNTSGGVTSNLSNAKIVEVIRNVVPDAHQDIAQSGADVDYEPAYDIPSAVAEYTPWLQTHDR
jgi:UDP-glucose 4-epimerase